MNFKHILTQFRNEHKVFQLPVNVPCICALSECLDFDIHIVCAIEGSIRFMLQHFTQRNHSHPNSWPPIFAFLHCDECDLLLFLRARIANENRKLLKFSFSLIFPHCLLMGNSYIAPCFSSKFIICEWMAFAYTIGFVFNCIHRQMDLLHTPSSWKMLGQYFPFRHLFASNGMIWFDMFLTRSEMKWALLQSTVKPRRARITFGV